MFGNKEELTFWETGKSDVHTWTGNKKIEKSVTVAKLLTKCTIRQFFHASFNRKFQIKFKRRGGKVRYEIEKRNLTAKSAGKIDI